jgi:hypothetical protein
LVSCLALCRRGEAPRCAIADTDTDAVMSKRFEHAAEEFTQITATRGDHYSVNLIYWAGRMESPPSQACHPVIIVQYMIREDVFQDIISGSTLVSRLRESRMTRDREKAEEEDKKVAGCDLLHTYSFGVECKAGVC